jgi:hypothetical protein
VVHLRRHTASSNGHKHPPIAWGVLQGASPAISLFAVRQARFATKCRKMFTLPGFCQDLSKPGWTGRRHRRTDSPRFVGAGGPGSSPWPPHPTLVPIRWEEWPDCGGDDALLGLLKIDALIQAIRSDY